MFALKKTKLVVISIIVWYIVCCNSEETAVMIKNDVKHCYGIKD